MRGTKSGQAHYTTLEHYLTTILITFQAAYIFT